MEEGRENEYLEQLSYAFTYATDLVTILRSGEFNPKTGFTLDTDTADTDFTALLSGLGHVLYPVSYAEFSKLLDLEHDHDYYHVVLNEIIFTILPVVLRGTALAIYHEAARSHPGDGRYILQRLRYDVEGVPDADSDRYWVKMRATIIDETKDPAPQLTAIRVLGDKHARINNDYSEAKRVKDLWHVLATSAKSTPFINPLYLNIMRDLRGGATFSFSALCLRIRTVWREELAYAARASPPRSSSPPKGPHQPHRPTMHGLAADTKHPYVPNPVGEWSAPPNAPYKRWVGTGHPCILCFRTWGITDAHPATRGACPYACIEAFATGRAPAAAKPASPRPPLTSTQPASQPPAPPAVSAPAADPVVQQPVSMTTFNVDDFPPRSTQELIAADFGMTQEELSLSELGPPAAALQAAFITDDDDKPCFQPHVPHLSWEPAAPLISDPQHPLPESGGALEPGVAPEPSHP